MTDRLLSLAEALLHAATRAGAGAADVLAVEGTSLSVDIRRGRLEQAERAEGLDLGLRVLIGGRQACVSASDTSRRTLDEMAARAVAMAREAPEDPHAGLADPADLAAARDAAGLEIEDPSPDPEAAALEADARAAEAAAMAVPGTTQVEASGGFSRQRVVLVATNGFTGGYGRTSRSVSAVAFTGTGTGMERDWAGETRAHAADMPPAAGIGDRAARRAAERLGARKPATGTYPVVFDERVASSLIGHLLAAANGAAVARGSSWLLGALGAPVLPRGLDLVEDPHRPRTGGSRCFDAEGLPTKARRIVEGGRLTGWTLDLATGRKLGMPSTASAARGTGAPPSPATTNVDLTQGTASRADLLAQMGTGLLVTSMIGSTINPTTGDYSRGASGFWVEGGQIAWPVNECTIAGNLRAMLMRIVPANDARPHLATRVPSLLVDGMTLAGA